MTEPSEYLAAQIRTRLAEGGLAQVAIDVRVADGRVVLAGCVKSAAVRRRVCEAVQGLAADHVVCDELSVTDRHGACRPRGRVVTGLVHVAAVGDLHVGRDLVDERLSVTFDDADMLLLAGDLTAPRNRRRGGCLISVLSEVEVPIVAVLGNHDHHAGTPDELEQRSSPPV